MRISKSLFWDTDISALNLKRHRTHIIERILEYGTEEDTRWLLQRVPRQAIRAVVKKSRRISPKSKNFWGLKLGLWQTPLRSTKKSAKIWPY